MHCRSRTMFRRPSIAAYTQTERVENGTSAKIETLCRPFVGRDRERESETLRSKPGWMAALLVLMALGVFALLVRLICVCVCVWACIRVYENNIIKTK